MTAERDGCAADAPRYSDLRLYRCVLRQARPYTPHIAGILLLGLLSTPLALLTPLPLKIAVDHAIDSEPLPPFLAAVLPAAARRSDLSILTFAAVLLIVVALLSQLQSAGSTLLRTYTGERLTLDFRSRLFHHVQRLSLTYHDLRGPSDPLYRIQYDVPAIQYIAIDGLIPFIVSTVTLASILYITARLNWRLALVALAVSPLLFLLMKLSRGRLRSRSRQVKQLESHALSVVQEVLGSLRVVKAFGRERREEERFVDRSNEGMWARIGLAVYEGGLHLLIGLTTAVGTAAVLFIGARSVKAGTLTLGELLLVMGYLALIYEPLKTISKRIASLQSRLASAERAFRLLEEEPDVAERPNARRIARARGDVVFDHVSFAYDGTRRVVHDVSLTIPSGMRVGIAGRTGAGKTTLMNLLIRFHDPTSGRILLDGTDLRDYRLTDLRNQFAIMLQEPVLFSTSIAENIGYARPEARHEAIVRAAMAANAHDFIAELPDGYDTVVGERGVRLSAGERQRIALARAFLRDAPILILDEPTSSVDVGTEAGIVEALERLMKGRTTFTIAHRLTTLEGCDLLVVMEGGRIVETTRDVTRILRDGLRPGRTRPGR
ncbi:MAG TPA: ABC transporter ATP-binding protein [Longimicrobiales bacterium]